jgi:hypothetical protein
VTATTQGYLAAAAVAADLLSEPAVAARWDTASALARMSVGALAGHLARQIFTVEVLLGRDPGDERLACSAGLPTPGLPVEVTDAVVGLLARLAARRHGATAVVRALSRAERAPATITAF